MNFYLLELDGLIDDLLIYQCRVSLNNEFAFLLAFLLCDLEPVDLVWWLLLFWFAGLNCPEAIC